MNKLTLSTAALITAASTGAYAGIDRSGQDISILFEQGNYAKFSLANVDPNITSAATGITQSATPFTTFSLGYKTQINDNLSFALLWDQPYGANVRYIDGPPPPLGPRGGYAHIDSTQVSGILRYQLGNGFSVHGGVFSQKVSGRVLSSPGLLNATSDAKLGGIAGLAYEKPEIAMRIALTYFTGVDYELTGTHNMAPTTGTVSMPEAFNLDFQTGIAPNTLLFGSVRHARYGGISLNTGPGGAVNWVDFPDDVTSYELGVGRKLNDQWSVALTAGYSAGADTGTSFLSPAGTSKSIGLGATYTAGDVKISGGVRYTKFDPKTIYGYTFEGDALSAGMSIGLAF